VVHTSFRFYFLPISALSGDAVLGKYRTILLCRSVYCLVLALAIDHTRGRPRPRLVLIALGAGGI